VVFARYNRHMQKTKNTLVQTKLIKRDLSFIDFNHRVLTWASNESVPLLERLRFLTIVSSNLDEFFEVRMAGHLIAYLDGETTQDSSPKEFLLLSKRTQRLVSKKYEIFNKELLPALKKIKLRVINEKERNKSQSLWVKKLFEDSIKPLLVPMTLDPSHPFPQVASKSLNYIARLDGENVFGRANEIAIVQVPRIFPRFFEIPSRKGVKQRSYSSLSSIVREHMGSLFPGQRITEFSQFRVTRHSDLALDEEDVKNLRTSLRARLVARPFGRAMRLEIAANCSEYLEDYLQTQFALPKESIYRSDGPVNLVRTRQLIELISDKTLEFPVFRPQRRKLSRGRKSVFDRLKEKEILLHHPYQSFEPVIEFLETAVRDDDVVAVHMTLYRTGSDPRLVELLKEAGRRGKVVMVVVELKARFDEAANIRHAEELEALGVQVVYGVHGLKTHSKMLLITRRERGLLVRYAHLSTGNYNAQTAKLYTDIGFMTADARMCMDVENLFKHLASQAQQPDLRKMILAPFNMLNAFLSMIERIANAARAGKHAKIRFKMNSLTDPILAKSLIDAASSGVCVDLCVRGACVLPSAAPVARHSGYIRVRSIVGRFLEHSRVYLFDIDGEQSMYLSSADLMSRNMHGRIEIAWPIESQKLRQQIEHECIDLSFSDTETSWDLHPNGEYVQRNVFLKTKEAKGQSKTSINVQQILMSKYGKFK